MLRTALVALTALSFLAGASSAHGEPPEVRITRVPEAGLQPRAILDTGHTLHLVYLTGEPAAADLWYVRRTDGVWTDPLRVNSEPGSAMAIGSIRGGQIALGHGGAVHVVWNGSSRSMTAGEGGHAGAPLLYSRLVADRFEPQRNLMTKTSVLDGGGTVAADAKGHVYAAWHASERGGSPGESSRQVFVAASSDGGASFLPERAATAEPTGACGCCGMNALVDRDGRLYLLYRAATGGTERGMMILTSRSGTGAFDLLKLDSWEHKVCPMSSGALVDTGRGVLASWERAGQVHCSTIAPEPNARPVPPERSGERKHPRLAVDGQGRSIVVWTVGTGWNRGGSLAWQLFDADGRPIDGAAGEQSGVPVWSFAAVVAWPGGGFEILY